VRILVTGASGLLGLNLGLELAGEHVVFGQVNSHPLRTDVFRVIHTDLLAPNAVQRLLERTQPEWVIHCAAMANIDACEADPGQAREINTVFPGKLADHVARGGARLLHVSTDAVFDGQRGGYTEEDTPHPLSVYAQTKLEGERAVAQANSEAIIARVNLFGWSLSGRRSLGEFFFYNLKAGKRVMGFTDIFFCPLLANDLAYIFHRMLASGLKGLFHVVSNECISKHQFGIKIARRFGLDENLISPASVSEGRLLASRSPNLTLRTDKIIQALDIQSNDFLPNISTGVEHFYTLYQQGYPQRLFNMAEQG
jgi:dTDP-4-dehydrorhamnose reductase